MLNRSNFVTLYKLIIMVKIKMILKIEKVNYFSKEIINKKPQKNNSRKGICNFVHRTVTTKISQSFISFKVQSFTKFTIFFFPGSLPTMDDITNPVPLSHNHNDLVYDTATDDHNAFIYESQSPPPITIQCTCSWNSQFHQSDLTASPAHYRDWRLSKPCRWRY